MTASLIGTPQGETTSGRRFRSDESTSELDESIRQVFERASEEYGELCDRLFADDPDFGVDTAENLTSR